jgi:chromosome segregation ATPase
MDPAVFKIVTEADDTALKSYDKSMGGVHTSSKKAANALKAFGKDALQAKDGAELATAGADALSHAFKMGLAGTAVIAGFKLVSDTIKGMATSIKEVGSITRDTVSELQRMGEPKNLAEAVKGIELLNKSIDTSKNKLGEISSGNWFTRFAGNVTGATKEIEAQIVTLERLRDVNVAFGMEQELRFKNETAGLSNADKAYYEVEARLKKNLEIVSQIKDANLKAQAEVSAQAIATAERKQLDLEQEKKSQQNLNEVIVARAKEELKGIEAEAKARQDAMAMERSFEAERKKAHLEELRRSAERISSLREEIKTLTEKAQTQAKAISDQANSMAQPALAEGGSGRGVGQRKTSAEIAGDKAYAAGQREGLKKTADAARAEAKKRIEQRGGKADGHAVTRELIAMRKEAGAKETGSPAEALATMTEELGKTNEKLGETQTSLNESQKAQAELTAKTDSATASFEGTDFSVNKMGEQTDLVSDSLGTTGESSGFASLNLSEVGSEASDSSDDLSDLQKSLTGERGVVSSIHTASQILDESFNQSLSDSNEWLSEFSVELSDLVDATSALTSMFNDLSVFVCEQISTENIYTAKIILN